MESTPLAPGGQAAPARETAPPKILLVEDESAVRQLLKNAVLRLGYRVLAAANSAEALAIWQQQPTEIMLLLTDLVMPGSLNGRELARELRQQQPALKVIFISGYSFDIIAEGSALETGVKFLAKPFKLSQLADAIQDLLGAEKIGIRQ